MTLNAQVPTVETTRDFVKGLASITIVVYNGERYVRDAIESALAQSYPAVEVLVVNDGSIDGTAAILQEYRDRITIVNQANGGLPAARNAGIQNARGEFIALMDHDDICNPDRIAVQVEYLKRNPEVGLCSSDFSAFDDTGLIESSHISSYYSQCDPALGGPAALYDSHSSLAIVDRLTESESGLVLVPTHQGRVERQIASGNFVHPPTVMVRAAIANAVGPFSTDAKTMCDWEWLARAAMSTEFGYIDRPLLMYRRTESQMSAPSGRPHGSLNAFRVAQSISERIGCHDSNRRREQSRFFGQLAADVAYENAVVHPATAVQYFLKSLVQYRHVNKTLVLALVRLILPVAVRDIARAVRGGIFKRSRDGRVGSSH